MSYFDTSVIAAYYCPEQLSDEAEKILLRTKAPVISPLVEVEMASTIARKIREGNLEPATGGLILAEFRSHIDAGAYRLEPIEKIHFSIAFNWIAMFSTTLRTLDALHCAIASQAGKTLITADERLASSARKLHIACRFIE